jgi:hypothetical protein
MHKLAITLAATMIIAGGLAWKADATTLTGVGGLTPLTKNYSPVEKVYYLHYGYGYHGYARRHVRRHVRRCTLWHAGVCARWIY